MVALAACGCTSAAPGAAADPLVEPGHQVFIARCAACHALQPGTAIVGPSLAGVATRAESRVPGEDARTYLEVSILQPEAYLVDGYPDLMPRNLAKDLTSEELDEVLAFLLTLK
jgi:mono/diheme cytochrome c family protein